MISESSSKKYIEFPDLKVLGVSSLGGETKMGEKLKKEHARVYVWFCECV